MNKKLISTINILLAIFFLSAPYIAFATPQTQNAFNGPSEASPSNPLVVCSTVDKCNWQNFLKTIDNVKDYAFQLVIMLSVGFIVYAGSIYIFARDNAGKREQAHNILSNVVVGFFLAAAGWLIVNTILKTLGVGSEFAPADLLQ